MMKFNTTKYKPLSIKLGLLVFLSSCGTAVNSAESEDKSENEAELVKAKHEKKLAQKKTRMTNDERIEFAKQDLAKILDLGSKEIMLLSSQTVTWKSGALGCPKPGEQYTQAMQSGSLIVLGAGGKHYRYHAGRKGVPKYCPNDRAQMPNANQSDI